MKTYREKLEDPRWQKKRLEVFQRDKFLCVSCGNGADTLHVHHSVYQSNPWESEMDDLSTLCSCCHDNLETAIKMLRENPNAARILPHVVNRALQLYDSNPSSAVKLLKALVGSLTQEQADDIAARTREG